MIPDSFVHGGSIFVRFDWTFRSGGWCELLRYYFWVDRVSRSSLHMRGAGSPLEKSMTLVKFDCGRPKCFCSDIFWRSLLSPLSTMSPSAGSSLTWSAWKVQTVLSRSLIGSFDLLLIVESAWCTTIMATSGRNYFTTTAFAAANRKRRHRSKTS